MGTRTMWWVAGLMACNGGNSDDTGGTETGVTTPSSAMAFTDANNYSYTANLSLASIALAEGQDATVDWSALTTDYRGRTLDPLDIDQITVSNIGLPQADVIAAINTNGLAQNNIRDYRLAATASQTSIQLSETSILGNPFEPANDFLAIDGTSWLLTLWKENDRGLMEIVMSQFVVPTAGEPNTAVAFTNDSASLAFSADLSTATALRVPADSPPYSLDWSDVTTDVNGKPYDKLLGDTLRIAHTTLESPEALAAEFLRLDEVSDQTYYANVYGLLSLDDLSSAAAVDGTAFPGFTTGGTWVIGVECTQLSCFSPAPLILAVVEVE
jgi:hypothetical protein